MDSNPITNPDPEPQPNVVPPVAPPPPPAAPPIPPAWTPDMAVAPPTGSVSSGYISNPFAMIKPSWQAIKANLVAFLVPTILFLVGFFLAGAAVVATLVAGRFTAASFANPSTLVTVIGLGVLIVIALILACVILAPYPVLVAKASLKGEKVSIGQTLRQSIHYSGRFIIISVLVGLPILAFMGILIILGILLALSSRGAGVAGSALSVILAIVAAVGILVTLVMTVLRSAWYSLAPYIVVDKNITAKEATAESKLLVKGHITENFGLLMLPSAFAIVPFLGFFASIALSILISAAMLIRYHQLVDLQASGAPKPKVHWANYVVIALAVVGGSLNRSPIKPNPYVNPKTPSFEQPANDLTGPRDQTQDVPQ